jgi:hypothetical protein
MDKTVPNYKYRFLAIFATFLQHKKEVKVADFT